MSRKVVTSIEVAEAAGVSQPTVSRAFDPDSSMSKATRDKVLSIAREMGYSPNVIARSLSTRRTNIVGVIFAHLTDSLFYPTVLEKLTKRLQQVGKQVLLFKSPPERTVDDVLPRVLGYQVDALVIASTTPGVEIIEESVRVGRPVIMLNRFAPGTRANAVCCDNIEGGRMVADFLLDGGHERIAYLSGIEGTSTNRMREEGFTNRLKERGFDNVIREQGAWSYEAGVQAARHLLSVDIPPDAIFCASDISALGFIDTARFEMGARVPEDISVVGFDDIPVASWSAYNLTTYRQPVDRMIEKVIELLTRPVDSPPSGERVRLAGDLVIRGSAKIPDDYLDSEEDS
jgi:DNA-binding LacI/PurR family transcriptional regulator